MNPVQVLPQAMVRQSGTGTGRSIAASVSNDTVYSVRKSILPVHRGIKADEKGINGNWTYTLPN